MKRVLTALLAIGIFASFGTIAKAAVESSELGDTGSSVTQIQQKLYDLGFLVCKPTGYFGATTQAAVTNFQKSEGLTADGKVGSATLKALFGSSASSTSTTSSSAGTTSSKGDALRYGDNNSYVTQLQQALHDKGFLKANPTGYFGSSTEEAVKSFQRSKGLTVDGIAGTATRKALLGSSYTSLTGNTTTAAATASKVEGAINPGDRGETVKTVQTRLKALGYYTYNKVTDFYGPITESAVRAFQKANGLAVDGVIGPKTLSKLNSSSAVAKSKATTTTAKASSSSNSKSVQVLGASSSSNSKVESMIAFGKTKLGCRYVWGATGPSTFDCSGFVLTCLKSVGVSAPRTSASMSAVSSWDKISKANLQRGDLVFFSSSSSYIGHVGIYLGGGQFIHASSGSHKVTISDINSSYYSRNFKFGRRVF